MLFKKGGKPQDNDGKENPYIPEIAPELCTWLGQRVTLLERTHPLSARTLTAIKLAALATPNLAPPAVPLLRVNA